MSDKETGGPAFPRPAVFTEVHGLASVEQDGMTLRDWFASQASEYDIKRHMPTGRVIEKIATNGGTKHIFKEAEMLTPEQARYRYADAMIKARNAN